MSTTAEIRFLGSVDSTNLEARKLVGEVAHPVWCVADEQLKGVGRRGRNWSSPKGNLYTSLLLPSSDDPSRLSLRSFVAALALRDAFLAASSNARITLKWPNDVLVNGAKVAGILLESAPGYLIIGIGVNVASAPVAEMVEPWAVRPAALNDLDFDVSARDLATHLAKTFDAREREFVTYGFLPIRTEWLQHAARLGEVITARLPNEDATGTFETVDEEGALILKTPTGRRAITAADIFFEGA